MSIKMEPCIYDDVVGAHELYVTEGLTMYCRRCGLAEPFNLRDEGRGDGQA
jgi:hypothetical protein